MRVTFFAVALVSLGLAAGGYYVASRPGLVERKSGLAALDDTNQIAARFGQSSALMVVARAREGTIADEAPLRDLDGLDKKLTRSGACKSVLSFFSLPQMIVGEEETEIRNMVEQPPTTKEERDALKQRLRAHPNAVGELVSRDLSRALFVCPISDPARMEEAAALASGGFEHLQLTRVGSSSLAPALSSDLMESSLLFLVLALVITIAGKPLVRMRAGLLAEIVLFQAALVYLVHPIIWPSSQGALGRLLGPSFDRAQSELDEVTGASRLLLVEVTADLMTARDVNAIAEGCERLRKDPVIAGKVSCPTDVLVTLAGALTGEAKIPQNDEQVKALWFFAGERPELGLIFTPDKHASLVRIKLDERVETSVLDAHLLQAFAGLSIAAGGMPVVDQSLERLRMIGLFSVAVLSVLAFLLGRRFDLANVALGEALLAPALLVKVGLVSRLLTAAGLLVLFATVGARSKRTEGAQTTEPQEETK
jgi:predicted RND superfamily exporter protein